MGARFAVISDAHLGRDRVTPEKRIGTFGSQAPRVLASVVRDVKKGKHDFLLSLGDAIRDEHAAADIQNLKRYRELIERSKIPTYHVLGNHDVAHLTPLAAAQALGMKQPYYAFDAGGVRFITIYGDSRLGVGKDNSKVPVDKKQLAWLAKQIRTAKKPIVIFTHIPIDEPAENKGPYTFYWKAHPWRAVVENRAEIRKLFDKNVIAVFSGHYHQHKSSTLKGVKYFYAPSITEYAKGKPSGEYLDVSVDGKKITVKRKRVV